MGSFVKETCNLRSLLIVATQYYESVVEARRTSYLIIYDIILILSSYDIILISYDIILNLSSYYIILILLSYVIERHLFPLVRLHSE